MLSAEQRTRYLDLVGKVVIVTGGAGGIGSATSMLFASMGAFVAVVDQNQNQMHKVISEIVANGGRANPMLADVSRAPDSQRAVSFALETFGRIDVLVNCAGIIRRASVVDTTEAEWDDILRVNLKAVFLMSKYVIPPMKLNGGGSIINVSSGWGITGGSRAAAYCAAKGGVVQLTKAMAVDHGPDHIRINCVCPGDTHTAMLCDEARQLGLPENALIDEGAKRPLGRVGKPDEIAAAIAYLASSSASFITGASLIIDGGSLAGSM